MVESEGLRDGPDKEARGLRGGSPQIPKAFERGAFDPVDEP